jgi:hypothetical protein
MKLFLCGCPRSGTTELCRILNKHPHLSIGMERYKFIYEKQLEKLNDNFFSKEKFFSFEST